MISAARRAIGCCPKSSTLTLLVCARELGGNNNSNATRKNLAEHLCSLCLFATATMIELVNFSLDFRWETHAVQFVRVL